jgi:hypothetical protein
MPQPRREVVTTTLLVGMIFFFLIMMFVAVSQRDKARARVRDLIAERDLAAATRDRAAGELVRIRAALLSIANTIPPPPPPPPPPDSFVRK